jgi:hypothetical protein
VRVFGERKRIFIERAMLGKMTISGARECSRNLLKGASETWGLMDVYLIATSMSLVELEIVVAQLE